MHLVLSLYGPNPSSFLENRPPIVFDFTSLHTALPEAPDRQEQEGRLTPERHVGWSTVWGLGGGLNSRHSKNTNYDTAVTAICDRYK